MIAYKMETKVGIEALEDLKKAIVLYDADVAI